ncbi:RNA-binding protein [Vibrio sp. HA2012]|uniref:RNA recognition motif domain-containing protein n=1 Tax=Vibrio sp. HA2012 TaxID=1971595 RepID=UPI000C2C9C0E|nr:RNA-binding protein [Vibrio sp. HA2012]PJC85008.1 RNA-binding protein [Vibrio sp. HA2012]
MNSKNTYLLLIILAVLGAVGLSQFPNISPALAFVLGLAISAFVLKPAQSSPAEKTDSKPSTKTLYVGNLPYKANEGNVRELFSEYGEVFAVRLMKDKRTGKRRGFGFVVMASADVETAISALNEKDYMQRTLKVRVANDPKHPEIEASQ